MTQEDFDLIQEEFKERKMSNMKRIVITKALINDLFTNYNSIIFIENYYDSEPLCYDEWEELTKTEEGEKEYEKIVKEYQTQRKRFCIWQEPYKEGIWGLTIKQIRQGAKRRLEDRRKESHKAPRLYINKNEDCVNLYYYSRDKEELDMWFTFYNKKER